MNLISIALILAKYPPYGYFASEMNARKSLGRVVPSAIASASRHTSQRL